MKTIYKYYKNEQSYLNQKGYFRLTHNQVRLNKETTKFTKIETSGIYTSLLQEMQDKNEYEYICAGLNSFEREVVVIDNDDETFGKSTLESLKALGLEPHCQKVKPNGHSQTYFFIEKYKIGSAGFSNGKYYENDDFENHEKWKRLTKMMNYLFDGDLGYTGYNCQNPLYINANVTSYRNINKLYTFDELYNFCLDKMSNIDNLDLFLKKMRTISMSNKKHTKQNKDVDIVIIFKDKKEVRIQSTFSIITNESLSNIDTEATMDYSIKQVDKSIDNQIFISTCCTCKSFWQSGKLDWNNFEYISKTAYNDYTDSYFAFDYTTEELINRIRNDVQQIIYNNTYGKMDWNKVGYTKKQRMLSLKIRKDMHQYKLHTILSIITNESLSERKIAEKYYEITKEKIGQATVHRILKEIKENKEKEINQSYTYSSIITNESLCEKNTNYIENLAEIALDIGVNENEQKKLFENEGSIT